jgi:hypothetical protein
MPALRCGNSLRTGNLSGNFCGFAANSAHAGADSRSYFNALSVNSLLSARGEIAVQFQCVAGEFPVPKRTGNFSARTGNFFGGTGNSISLIGSVETLCRSDSNTWFRHFRAERREGSPDSIPGGMAARTPYRAV